jgi:DNA-binding MarR family transcriptional regulator
MSPSEVDRVVDDWRREFPQVDIDAFQLLASMNIASQVVENEFREVARKNGMSTGELRVLFAVRRARKPEGLRPTAIFKYLLISSGAVTKQIGRLVKRGLVTSEPDPTSQKSFLIKLTPEGAEVAEKAFLMTAREFGKVGSTLRSLGTGEKEMALQFLQRIIQSR